MKSQVEYCISRGIKNLPPFVYCEVFKKCASRVDDYVVVEICTDPFDQYNVIFKIVEPEYYKRFNVPTCTWANREPERVVIVRLEENQLLMVRYDELADIIQQYKQNHPEQFEDNGLDESLLSQDQSDGDDDDDFFRDILNGEE